jgi:hypothetical protein
MAMPRGRIDWAAVDQALRHHEFVLTHAQLREVGLHSSTITRWIGPRGRWQRLLPGVVLAHRGTPTRRELLLGALAYAGAGAVITGEDAFRAHRASVRAETAVRVLIPEKRQRRSYGYVHIERTRRLPQARIRQQIPYAPISRATVDSCRATPSLDGVRDLISGVIQGGLCPLEELRQEILAAARQRTSLSRHVLAEIGDGVRSVAEAKVREVLIASGIPSPEWNIRLTWADSTLVLSPDAYWRDVAVALEIDSLAWHLDPESYRRTKRRERLLTSTGITVIAFTPAEILDDPAGCVEEIRTVLRHAANRPLPEGIVIRAAA